MKLRCLITERNFHNGDFKTNEVLYTYDWPDCKASDAIWTSCNYEAGDSYGWPGDNMSEGEVDWMFEKGQRIFCLTDESVETVATLKLCEDEDLIESDRVMFEYANKNEYSKLKLELVDELVEFYIKWQKNPQAKPFMSPEDCLEEIKYHLDKIKDFK